MSDVQIEGIETEAGQLAGPSDFIALLKPRVMSLVVFTALTGLVLAPGGIHPVIAFAAILSIAVGAGASGALNMWYDADIDRVMSRTRNRPIPAGRITRSEALAFGLTLAGLSVLVLTVLVNPVAGALLAFTIFFYVVIYSMWLKRWTPQNIVIGGAAGAFPPIIGWASVTGSVSLESIVLFLIIFMWTPPHFWALALFKSDDYARAGIPMLPVVSGVAETKRQILLYSLLLAPLGVLPAILGFATPAYGVLAGLLGVAFVVLAIRVFRMDAADTSMKAAKRLFAFSILYLFLLFAMLLAERVAQLAGLIA
ncbi:protoheme IX farnesyltransferase [Kaistia hirudinis]|uniref:Protoheme IX farnesyltransferase n=1 Tax=Kaistia hirudinis TaxID=1293440 RepID=A0A840AMQ7_9HYPH|nr:heme o synthase [Kaistia hirudinis]MBB3930553.1 protoheme IX farnesyltransferase [Kaistia hirudinis]MBN9017470.1 heme o synthase [Hyphomicrobiales bacterium]